MSWWTTRGGDAGPGGHYIKGVTPLSESLRTRLEQVVGPAAVLIDPERLLVYESDALGRFHQLPRAVVLPKDTGEAARVVALLAEADIPIVPRGAGTGLSGGAVPHPEAVILGTARMNRILDFRAETRRARVQSGVLNSHLTRLVAPHGLAYAPDPSSQTACTLGGNVAENSGGPHCLKYGVTRRYVTGLTLVDGGGKRVELGGDRAGPFDGLDLVGPVVGSEGCFGLVTEIELALVPATEAVRTLLALFPDTASAGEAVTAIISDGLLPAALEIIDRHTIAAVESSAYAAGYPVGVGAALVVEFDGPARVLDAEIERAETHCREAGATDLRRAEDPDMRTRLWQGRKKAFGTMGRLAPDLMVQDATVPRSSLPTVLRAIDEVAERHTLRIANVFHAGDGNLHPNILYDRRDESQTRTVESASREIMRICVEAGGTITGEHGVGLDKRDYLPMVAGPEDIAAMRTVRDAYDPERRWNPGKVLPDPDHGAGHDREAGAGADPDDDTNSDPSVKDEVFEVEGADALATLVRESRETGRRLAPDWAGPVPGHSTVRYRSGTAGAIDFSPPDMSLTVGTDRRWGEVARAAAEAGQWIPLVADPARPVAAALRPAAAGAFESGFGDLRELLLGLELVTGSGSVLRLGGRVVKNVAGFDLIGLFAPGGLGWPTAVTFRTHPLPDRIELLRIPATGSSWTEEELSRVEEWPDPQLRTPAGTFLLRLGDVAGEAPGTAERIAEGPDAIDTFVAEQFGPGRASSSAADPGIDRILIELRPPFGTVPPSPGMIAERVGAEMAGWRVDPLLRRIRIALREVDPDSNRLGEMVRALAGSGTGVNVLSGSPALHAAVNGALDEVDPGRGVAGPIARRIRAAFAPGRTLLDPSRIPSS